MPDFCNECGNCRTFCPTRGAPCQDKHRVHLSRTSLEAHGEGFFLARPGEMECMSGGRKGILRKYGDTFCLADDEAQVTIDRDSPAVREIRLHDGVERKDLQPVVEAILLCMLMADHAPFTEMARVEKRSEQWQGG